jgi:protoporphyrinogen oxidase
VIYECLLGFVNTLVRREGDAPGNFEQYILHHFGEGIAKHFMIPYNYKLWGVHPREITSAWCQRFVPVPTVEQVIAGSVGAGPARLGYNTSFLYPNHGGIETFTRALSREVDSERVVLDTSLEAIDPVRRTVRFAGETHSYHAVISTLALPRLIELMVEPPREVVQAAARLRATPVRYLNVGVKTPPPADYHWVYVPEEHFPFYRVGIFSNAMPSMAPAGCASLYVELASRSGASDETVRQALTGLVEIGAIARVEDVVFADLHEIDPAYVVFDDHYQRSVDTLHGFLQQHRIYSRGRYGAWIYNSMEDSLLAGKEVAGLVDGLAAR